MMAESNKIADQQLPASRTIRELVSGRAKALPNHPILGYPDEDDNYHEYTYQDLDNYAKQAAVHYAELLPTRRSSDDKETIVGLLGQPTFEYLITIFGLSYLGFTILFLSPRLADQAHLSLLKATCCRHIVIPRKLTGTATSLKCSLPDLQVVPIITETFHQKTDLNNQHHHNSIPVFDLDKETKKTAWILHSSGSTGPPRPISVSHHALPHTRDRGMAMEAFGTLPLFHAYGLFCLFGALGSTKKVYLYSGTRPLTSENLLRTLNKHQFEQFIAVPYTLKLLSESTPGLRALAAVKVVTFGTSACPDALGDYLVANGVNLVNLYGTSETSAVLRGPRPIGDQAWNYLRVDPASEEYIRWEDRGANLFELVVLDGYPSKAFSNRPDGAYATKDLFEPHATIAGAWKYVARLDDTIVLMNGEKAIPIAMEMAVRANDLVREVVCFGAGRSRLGMLVVVSERAREMESDDVIEKLWPTIEAENTRLPSYAHISKETIRILPADTSFPQTDKATVIRQAFYRAFADQIDQLYEGLESESTGTLVLSETELRTWLRTQILEMLPASQISADDLSEETDLFSLGMDSLQSTQLRTRIMQNIQLEGHSLASNVVFENPTIAKLAARIVALRDGKQAGKVDAESEMQALITKYGSFPAHEPRDRDSNVRCVVVTGATGSLGAHIVSQLVQCDDVDEVCCLVRASSDEAARERISKSLAERCVDDLSSKLTSKITTYASDMSDPHLGLSRSEYISLQHKVRTVIHSAWSVNFNKALSSFEIDCIAATKNLILLCLSAHAPEPATFSFCSSVSTIINLPSPIVTESLPPTLSSALEMGYAQSKLVTENLVDQCAKQTGMTTKVLRIGQVVADTQHGVWNATEAIPLMLQSATTIGALPTLDEEQRWLPVDIVARTCIDISLSRNNGSNQSHQCGDSSFFNVVNPRTFHWTKDLLPALRTVGLEFREVDQREWIKLLRKSNPDPKVNPTIKLVEFFAAKYDRTSAADEVVGPDEHAKKFDANTDDVAATDLSNGADNVFVDGVAGTGDGRILTFITQNAETLSPALAQVAPLDDEYVRKFVEYFQRTSWGGVANAGKAV